MVGPIQMSHDGRFVYIGNRNNGTTGTPPVFLGGENNVAVFSIDKSTGEPTLIQNADTRGFVPRTITFDKTGKILVAANQTARNVLNPDGSITAVPTSLAVFRINSDGTLEVRAQVRRHRRHLGGISERAVESRKVESKK